jgi:thiamine phosphate synthase YjbQ (UPF0047 family)
MVAIFAALVATLLTSDVHVGAFGPIARSYGGATTTGTTTSLQLKFMTHYEEVQLETNDGMSVFDITPQIEAIVEMSGCKEGTVTVLSKHSTVSVSINEMEGRLVDDIRQCFLNLVPPHLPWLHNDLDYRVGPEGWPGGDEAWRDFRRTQPGNTHSHLIAMMLGTSESIPISEGEMMKGKYQSILVVDIDGPKSRGIAVQITGGN